VLVVAGINYPKLDSTASHPSSLSHSLPCRVVCLPGHPMTMIMGGLVLRLQCTCFLYFYTVVIHWLAVGVSVSATVTAVSGPSVSAVVSVTAITGLQIWHHFRLRPKPEKVVSVGLYNTLTTTLSCHGNSKVRTVFCTLSLRVDGERVSL